MSNQSISAKHNTLTHSINKKINDVLWHLNSEHLFSANSDIRVLENSQILFKLEIDYHYPITDIINIIDDVERIFKECLDADIEIDRTTASITVPYPDRDDTPELYFTVEYKVLNWKLYDAFIESYDELKKFNAEKTRNARIKAKNASKSAKFKKLDKERKLYEKLKRKFKNE